MTEMLPIQRRFILREQVIGAGMINVVLNALLALAMFISRSPVPLWGLASIASDTLATTFLLPLLFCLISTPLVRREVASGRIPPLIRVRRDHLIYRCLPVKARLRAVVLGIGCTAIVSPIVLIVFHLLGVSALHLRDFVLFKAAFAGILAAMTGPIVGLWAIVQFSDDQ